MEHQVLQSGGFALLLLAPPPMAPNTSVSALACLSSRSGRARRL